MNGLKIATAVAVLVVCLAAGIFWMLSQEGDDSVTPTEAASVTPQATDEEEEAAVEALVADEEEAAVENEATQTDETENKLYGSGDAPQVLIEVVDPDDEPIAGARVYWTSGEHSPTSETDDEGKARLYFANYSHLYPESGSAHGKKLRVEATGFAAAIVWIGSLQNYRRVRMEPGITLRGRVLDENGSGLDEARIAIAPGLRGEKPVEDAGPTVWTGASGYFEFADLPDNGVTLTVERHPYAPALHYVDADSMTRPTEIILDQGRTVTLNVIDENNRPVEDALVTKIKALTDNPVYRWALPELTTARNGSVDLEGLPVNTEELTVEVLASGYPKAEGRWEHDGRPIAPSVTVRLVDQNLGSLSGTVWDTQGDPFSGKIILAESNATSEENAYSAAVTVHRDGSFLLEDVRTHTNLEAFGHWWPLESRSSVGPLHLASLSALEPGEQRTVELMLTNVRPIEFVATLDDGSPAEGVRIEVLRPGHFFNAQGTTGDDGRLRTLLIDGTYSMTATHGALRSGSHEIVVDATTRQIDVVVETGEDLTGSLVDEQGNGLDGFLMAVTAGESVLSTTTEEDGSFRFGSVPDIPVRVWARSPLDETHSVVAENVRVGDSPVKIVWSTYAVVVRVQDKQTGAPLRAHVDLYEKSAVIFEVDEPLLGFGPLLTKTSPEGTLTFSMLAPGERKVHVSSPGYFEKFEEVVIDKDTEILIQLDRGATIVLDTVTSDDIDGLEITTRQRNFRRYWHVQPGRSAPIGPIRPGARHISLTAYRREIDETGNELEHPAWTARLRRVLDAGENVIPWREVLDVRRED